MKAYFINRSKSRMPRAFLERWVRRMARELTRELGAEVIRGKELGLVFLDAAEAAELNKTYRGKNYPTDVLSFEGDDQTVLGELVICPDVIERQAEEHDHTVRDELGYMVLHGVLHLLGFEHERGGAPARRMFALQDRVFEHLCAHFEAAKAKTRRRKGV